MHEKYEIIETYYCNISLPCIAPISSYLIRFCFITFYLFLRLSRPSLKYFNINPNLSLIILYILVSEYFYPLCQINLKVSNYAHRNISTISWGTKYQTIFARVHYNHVATPCQNYHNLIRMETNLPDNIWYGVQIIEYINWIKYSNLLFWRCTRSNIRM